MEEWLITSLLKRNSGHIVKWSNGLFEKVDGSEGSGPNGITLDRSSNMLFVSYNQGDKIVKFDLSINKKINSYFVQSPDNIFLMKTQHGLLLLISSLVMLETVLKERPVLFPFQSMRLIKIHLS